MPAVFAAPLALLLSVASAQEPPATRLEELQQAVEKKKQELTPEQETRGEQIFEQIHDKVIDSFLAAPSGLGVKFGGLLTGSGFGMGPRYLLPDLAGERVRLEAFLVGSLRRYWTAEARLSFPRIAGRRFAAEFVARHSDAPRMPYFGPGADSRRSDVSSFRREDTTAGLELGWRPDRRYLLLGYYAGALQVNVGPGRDERWPSSDLVFSPQTMPGIDRQAHYLRGGPFLHLDFRDRPADPHAGGAYSVAYVQNWDRRWRQYSFNRLEAQAEHYFPFLNQKRVIAFRVRTELSYTRGGDRIPFYMQPTLGGPDDLRGYRAFRYYDNNATVANAEYRWEVSPMLDMAAFFDAGNVFERPGLIGFRDVRTAGGLGFRVKTRDAVVARLDLGASREGFRIWFKFSNIFLLPPR
ncbi:MAG: BamA/TamA family outer membrane protein [Bryobacteraceae bacterium]|nr:BamA/TamA family outer membrane protein [Bryobacteraceae bacterium]